MAEELQNLLDRIQQDGIEKAEAKAAEIISAAERKAASIVSKAEKDAADTARKAKQDAQVFTEHGRKTLEQAARDVILSVGNAVSGTLDSIISDRVGKALTIDVLKQALAKVVETYCKETGKGAVEVLLNQRDEAEIRDFFMSEFRKAAEKGLQIRSDNEVVAGFKLSVSDGKVEHDFTQEAIAEALCRLVRPRLAEIVKNAMNHAP